MESTIKAADQHTSLADPGAVAELGLQSASGMLGGFGGDCCASDGAPIDNEASGCAGCDGRLRSPALLCPSWLWAHTRYSTTTSLLRSKRLSPVPSIFPIE
jgi:hypothetical protein